MKAGIRLLILIALAGCTKQSAREEEKLEMVKQGRDNVAICDQSKAVAAAYLNEHDEAGYEQAKLQSNLDCARLADEPFNETGLDVTSDNLTALAN